MDAFAAVVAVKPGISNVTLQRNPTNATAQSLYRQRKADKDFDQNQIMRAAYKKLKEKGHYPEHMTLGQIIAAIESL